MGSIVEILWLIPLLPLIAAGIIALLPPASRRAAAALAVGSMGISLVLSCAAFKHTLGGGETVIRETVNFAWFEYGNTVLRLGWVLDPLTAAMLVMVTFVAALIFIYSIGYMAHDDRCKQFFCFLSLFAAAMLGLVLANSLLLFFICWELVGLASYLLIGFWFDKPSAAAAAKKAFITTRIGDIGFFIGLLWLAEESGTLLFYDDGLGCLEGGALSRMAAVTLASGMGLSTALSLLIFCGAIGKSGQVPLHVWLPDAMEGPTPVSALIHAATMVAAGVFLMARIYPLLALHAPGSSEITPALQAVTWIGAITAVFAALIATAQNDIKRILAYSTVSQLGYMFMGLGVGGVAVAMFHLLTHAFFKALLFLGAGSVIHGCHDEQDIRRMGGLKKYMPATFATYAIGMLALAGFPLFSGFWSKDEILHAAHGWSASHWPFYLGLTGAFLTAFYMTRQVCLVFFGSNRAAAPAANHAPASHGHGRSDPLPVHTSAGPGSHSSTPHESPAVMTVPLMILAVFAFGLGFLGTPYWPWIGHYLGAKHGSADGVLALMLISSAVVLIGLFGGWFLYGRTAAKSMAAEDPIQKTLPSLHHWLAGRFFVDELYEGSVIALNRWAGGAAAWLDRIVIGGVVATTAWAGQVLAWAFRSVDDGLINHGFDAVCSRLKRWGALILGLQDGQSQTSLRALMLGLCVLVLFLTWGFGR